MHAVEAFKQIDYAGCHLERHYMDQTRSSSELYHNDFICVSYSRSWMTSMPFPFEGWFVLMKSGSSSVLR